MMIQPVRVKICGLTQWEDAKASIKHGADALGFIFYPKSPRYLPPQQAKHIVEKIPPFVSLVAVMVDPDSIEVEEILNSLPIHCMQFHGNESEKFCKQFDVPYLKAIRPKKTQDIQAAIQSYPSASALLLDTPHHQAIGGTGHTFDWSMIPQQPDIPIILSGGLNPENVGVAIHQVQPYAVDVCSGVESKHGIKDHSKIKSFLRSAKANNESISFT